MNQKELKFFLDQKAEQYNQPNFIPNDPICIPHSYTKLQDIEIMGFFAAILAWGQRITIIRNCTKLGEWMDNAPHDFLLNHQAADLKRFLGFVHRTFNDTDLLYCIEKLKQHYLIADSLESAFCPDESYDSLEKILIYFNQYFFSLPHAPTRTHKHIPSPIRGSACKRLCMYLRWMVRHDTHGVDFGLWKRMSPSILICPLDVHTQRSAISLGLLTRTQADWKAATELTQNLRLLDAIDPIRYDFALFGMGVENPLYLPL